MTSSPHSSGRVQTAATRSQGRRTAAPAKAGCLDGASPRGGYTDASRKGPAAALDFARLRRLVPLAAILSRYGFLAALKRSGAQFTGCCPIHGGTNPRQLVLNLKDNVWRCFGDCHAGGGTLEFVAAMERVPLARAAELTAEWFALDRREAVASRAGTTRRKQMTTRPTHRAYVVEPREGEEGNDQQSKGWWTKIGVGFPHADGKGFNLILSAFPTTGRIVLREWTAEDEEHEQKKAPKRSKSA